MWTSASNTVSFAVEPFNCTVPKTIVLFDYIFNRSTLLIALFAIDYVNRDCVLYVIIIPKGFSLLLDKVRVSAYLDLVKYAEHICEKIVCT